MNWIYTLKSLLLEFVDVTQVPQGLPPHRGIFDNKIGYTAYHKRQRRNPRYVPECEKIKR